MAAAPSAPVDERPTVVFLHGTVLTGAAWTAQIAALDGAYHCLAPDLPGHGTAAGEVFTLDGAAERIAGLIEREAHGGRAILVGLSLGGYVAMTVAARWPERVAGLALAGSTSETVGLPGVGFRLFALLIDRLPEPIVRGAYTRAFRLRFPASIADPILAAGLSFRGGAVAVRSLLGVPFKPRLAGYPGPSLLLNGELDLFFRPAARAFAAVAADPGRVLIRRATHLANLDQPARFSAAIRRFAEAGASRPAG
jgi:pimeloyl-ACP methyl ester carboxylesterase